VTALQGQYPRHTRKFVLFLAMLLGSIGLAVLGPSGTAHANPGCNNGGVYAIFARGSGEHFNDLRATEFEADLRNSLSQAQPPIGMAYAELGNFDNNYHVDGSEYPAVGGLEAGFTPTYRGSVAKGANEIIAYLNDRVLQCPQETIVLGGYSQGADVVGWALQGTTTSWLTTTAKNHIGFVALYGDPKFDPGPLDDRINNTNFSSKWWWVRGSGPGWRSTGPWNESNSGMYQTRAPYPYVVAPDFEGRFGSWCDANDGVCTGMFWRGWGFRSHPDIYQDKDSNPYTCSGHRGWISCSVPEIAYKAVQVRNQLNPGLLPATAADYTLTVPNPGNSPPVTSIPIVTHVKRTTGPDGVREVYASTMSTVTEAWWYPGGDGVHTDELIHISQENIVGFDKVNEPDGATQSLYTAVPDGVWETWWRPSDGTHSAKIVTGLTGVRQVIAAPTMINGQYTHRLYLLAEDGPHEVWWRDGGDGLHTSLLNNISGPVTMTKSTGPDGVDQLYVATPTWVYELWWWPGQGVHNGSIINITQGDIRSLSKGANLSDGGQLLYTGTSTTAWQTYWNSSVGPSHGTIATGQTGAIQVEKDVYNGVHELYLATGDHVQEYWWNGPSSGGGELIRISQNNITSFDKSSDGADQQVYTASGDLVYETWWRAGVSPTSGVLFRVAR
jgi:hypothetical protein